MIWSSLLQALVRALIVYLELKGKSFYYDVIHRSKIKQEEYAKDIEKLRSSHNPNDADLADLLRKRLVEERTFAEHISTFYTPSLSGAGDKDP